MFIKVTLQQRQNVKIILEIDKTCSSLMIVFTVLPLRMDAFFQLHVTHISWIQRNLFLTMSSDSGGLWVLDWECWTDRMELLENHE